VIKTLLALGNIGCICWTSNSSHLSRPLIAFYCHWWKTLRGAKSVQKNHKTIRNISFVLCCCTDSHEFRDSNCYSRSHTLCVRHFQKVPTCLSHTQLPFLGLDQVCSENLGLGWLPNRHLGHQQSSHTTARNSDVLCCCPALTLRSHGGFRCIYFLVSTTTPP
jgi:hypothetical protein